MPAVNQKILKWARETAGFSLEEGAKAIGLHDTAGQSSSERLAALESGDVEPSRTTLLKMSQKYRRSLLVFYLKHPPQTGDRGQDFRSLPGENHISDNALLDALIRDLKTRQSIVKGILEDDEIEPLPFIGSMAMNEGIIPLSHSIQKTIGFQLKIFRSYKTVREAFTYLRHCVESSGVFVLLVGDLGSHHTSLSIEHFRGFAIADSLAPFVVVNDHDARSAWSFTILHEVAHLWLGTTGVSSTSTENEMERFCNDVAGEILLPKQELEILKNLAYLPMPERISHISEFAKERNVSRSMVAYKLFRTRLIREPLWRELTDLFLREWNAILNKRKEKNKKSGPTYYIVRRHRIGPSLLNLVNRSIRDGLLSITKAAKVLGVKPRKVETLLREGLT